MPDSSALAVLATLLRGANATPVVVPERIAPSTIYDLQYRLAVTSCAYVEHAQQDLAGVRRMSAAKLKLVQFVATRPWLVPYVREWAETRHEAQFGYLRGHAFRRGYLGDTMHDHVVDFLVANGAFLRSGANLLSGERFDLVRDIVRQVEEESLFAGERAAVGELRDVKLSVALLESA